MPWEGALMLRLLFRRRTLFRIIRWAARAFGTALGQRLRLQSRKPCGTFYREE